MLRIMPLGDSITAGLEFINDERHLEKGGYRAYVWRRAKKEHLRFEFVGSQDDGPDTICARHEGYPGWTAQQLMNNVQKWLQDAKPDIVLIMCGTNDIIQGTDPDTVLSRIVGIVGVIDRYGKDTGIGLASICPLRWSRSRKHLQPMVEQYNSLLEEYAESLGDRPGPVVFADVHSGLERRHLAGTHPTSAGYKRIGEVWYPAVKALCGLTRE